METLKIRFKLYALEYEVEGQQETAKEEFKNFNDNILTQILSKVNITLPTTSDIKELPPSVSNGSKEEKKLIDYPTLKDVKIRDLPKTETHWLLIYAFYASNFGDKEFTKDDILKLYSSTDRKTDNRIANLSNNIKRNVSALYFKSSNDETSTFIILPSGKGKAIEILEGKSSTKQQSKKKVNQSKNSNDTVNNDDKKSKTSQAVKFVDLKFNLTEINSLKDFFKTKLTKTQNDEVVVALEWFQKNKEQSGATLEEINYLIKISTNNVPIALEQVLRNMKGAKLNLIEKSSEKKYTLTSLGSLHSDILTKKTN